MGRPARHHDGRFGRRAEPDGAALAGRLDRMRLPAQRNALARREGHPFGAAADPFEDPRLLRRRKGQRRPLRHVLRQGQDDPVAGSVDAQDHPPGIGTTTEGDGQPFALYDKLTVSGLARVALHGVRNISSPHI